VSPEPFLIGANLPWLQYGEFGANAWNPRGGLGCRSDYDQIRARLRDVADSGVRALRWFLLCDGRAGIRFGPDGSPLGLDDALFADVETALSLAGEADVRVVFVLFDFLWCGPPSMVNGVQLGGRCALWQDDKRRAALLSGVVEPLLDRFGGDDRVLAWDVLNEPEWITRGVGTRRPWRTLGVDAMRLWIGDLVGAVHRHTRHLATVGSACAAWLWLVRDLGLDVYQPHWYDRLEPRAPLDSALAAARLDRPAWLGELPTAGSQQGVETLLARARAAGYSGAFIWSVAASDRASDSVTALPALRRWTASVQPEQPAYGEEPGRWHKA
jgi:hypothetical protein